MHKQHVGTDISTSRKQQYRTKAYGHNDDKTVWIANNNDRLCIADKN